MKGLIIAASLLSTSPVIATSLLPENFEKACPSEELSILANEARSEGHSGLADLAKEIAAAHDTCSVRHHRPTTIALCGAPRPHTVTFNFETERYGQVEIVVDAHQIQCLRIYRAPTVESIKMSAFPTLR